MPRPDGRASRFTAVRYARQRRVGYPWLRFDADLEGEYREGYVQLYASRIRLVHAFGILGILGFIAMDALFGAKLQPAAAVWVLLTASIPALLVPIIATFDKRTTRYIQKLVTFSILVAGLSIDGVVFLGRLSSAWFPYDSILLITIYVFFVSGLLWRDAILCGMAIWVGYVALSYWFTSYPATKLMYEAYYLALANGIGVIGRYMIEYQERMSFLMQRELRYLAQHDSLTGLMNRRAFRAHAERVMALAAREQRNIGLLLFDLDHFKRINDTHGHLTGDAVLRVAAQALCEFVRRPMDAAGRFGGDEFVALWYDVDEHWFGQMKADLPAGVKSAIWAEAPEVSQVTISGGAVLAWPQRGLSFHDVMRVADESLYEVKRANRDRVISRRVGMPQVHRAGMAA